MYAVRPVLVAATGPNDAGFVSAGVIESTDNPDYQETYSLGSANEDDEVLDDSARLVGLKPGVFVAFSNGRWGTDVRRLAAFHPGLENGGSDWLAPLRILGSALVVRLLFGRSATMILYAGPVAWMRAQLMYYRLLGFRRCFFWRWDRDAEQIREVLR